LEVGQQMSDPFEQLWGPPKANAAGPLTMNLIKGFEGYAPTAKWDVRQHSGGYGSRAKPGEQFTPEIAEQRLGQEVAPINAWLDKNITQPLTPERRAAFNSFGYNLGVDDLEKLKPDINRGDWSTVGNRMLSFNKALNEKTGQLEPLAGLITRRQKEAAMITGGAAPQESAQMPMMPQQRQQGPLANAMSGLPNSMVPGILGGGDEPGYFGKLLSDPTFLTGASVLGAGLSGQDFGTALARGSQGAQAQSEMFDKRRKAVAWQKMWGQNGQPNAESPLLKGVPPEVLPIIQQMGPEDGMRALQQIAMKRLEPRQLTPVSPGATLYDERQGQAVYTAPSAEGGKPPAGYRMSADGQGLEFIPGGPADPALKVKDVQFSEGASKAANFANMMQQSEAVLAPYKENPLGVVGQMNEMWPEGMANRMRDPAYQAYRQSAMQWVRAKLRKESGAAISTPEFEGEFQTFFPQPGDTPEVIAQKKQARDAALMGMKAESRGAYDQLFQGGPPPQPGAGAAPGGGVPQPMPQQAPQGAPPPQMQQQGAPARLGPNDKAAFDAMPSGTQFIDPEGNLRTKP
jgi:GH24 family phage-related lysozyme (muramidase)